MRLRYQTLSKCIAPNGYRPSIDAVLGHRLKAGQQFICHSERNEEYLVCLTRFGVSLGMTEERLSALSRFKWVAPCCSRQIFLGQTRCPTLPKKEILNLDERLTEREYVYIPINLYVSTSHNLNMYSDGLLARMGFRDDVNKLIVDYLSERGSKVEIQKTRKHKLLYK